MVHVEEEEDQVDVGDQEDVVDQADQEDLRDLLAREALKMKTLEDLNKRTWVVREDSRGTKSKVCFHCFLLTFRWLNVRLQDKTVDLENSGLRRLSVPAIRSQQHLFIMYL